MIRVVDCKTTGESWFLKNQPGTANFKKIKNKRKIFPQISLKREKN